MVQRSGLLDEIKAAQQQHKPSTCTVGIILRQYAEKDPDREALMAALSDPTIYGTSISKVLKSRGLEVGAQAIQRHRRKACGCE